MALYAISDLHLSFTDDKPMDVFGDAWLNHDKRIEENWKKKIKDEDTVLIGGDLSWSMKMDDAKKELDFIAKLPGKKIAIKGNHDYWWTSISKLNKMYDNFSFIQNNFFTYKDYAICGSRGWICEGSDKFTLEDQKIFDRELIRIELSITEAIKSGYKKIIFMIHYPPTNEKFEFSRIQELLQKYPVEKVIYGHLHGNALKNVYTGLHGGIEYILTSGDYIDFDPVLLIE